jgi:hypothetical protein
VCAEDYFPCNEGIDILNHQLFFVSKEEGMLLMLELDALVYEATSTEHGAFDGQPDQIKSIIGDNGVLYSYFTEDRDNPNGIHGRDKCWNGDSIL